MAPSPATMPAKSRETPSVGYTLGAIMLLIALVGLAGAYGFGAWVHAIGPAPSDASQALVARTLVGKELHIPGSWLRGSAAATAGFASRIDFAVTLPLGPGGTPVPVAISLLPLSQVGTSVALLDGVYLHQFMPNEVSGPPGLVGKPLYGTEGYEGETVWYDALSHDPFVAKCSNPPDGQGPAQCLRTVALPGGIAAVYAFDATALGQWKAFDADANTILQRIGAL